MADLRLALRQELAKPKYGLATLKRPVGSEPYLEWEETPASEPYGEKATVVDVDGKVTDTVGATYQSFTWRAGSDNPKLSPPIDVKVPNPEYETAISELLLKSLIRKGPPAVYANDSGGHPFHAEKYGEWLDVPTIVRFLLVLKYARPDSKPETEPYFEGMDHERLSLGLSALPTLLGEPRSDWPYPPRPLPASIAFSYPRICTGEYLQVCSDDAARTLMRLHLSPYLWIDDYISGDEGWPADM